MYQLLVVLLFCIIIIIIIVVIVLYSRLSFSKNGVIRMDGFSTPEQFDDEALALWDPGVMQNSFLDKTTAIYILSFIGDKFCQMVVTENTAATWVKKDSKKSFQMTDILIKWDWLQLGDMVCVLSQASLEASS